MKRPFLPEITYMRGLCMLGVIAIHVGSITLLNPAANPQLISVLEILSRFSVPAFFFLSAFGLFYHTSVDAPFSYGAFLRRRIQVVLWPYLAWSLLYIIYSGLTMHSWDGLLPRYLLPTLFFGNGYYHLYFMVILLWFYLLMPVWRVIVRAILPHPVLWLSVIFIGQTAFNFYFAYFGGHIVFENPALQYAYSMRLNYWVAHYVWIFLLGAVLAEKYEVIPALFWRWRVVLTTVFALSIMAMLGGYYYVMNEWHYTLLEAIYTIHQLSPMGMVYTGAGTLFFLFYFQASPISDTARAVWEQLGEHSYGIYLIHPFMLIIVTAWMTKMNFAYTVPAVIALYVCAVCMSYLGALALTATPKWLHRILLGH